MRFRDTIQSAFEGLHRNRARSLLTTLGIIIGVGSVVLMVSIGSSFERYIIDQIESFGGDTFEIHAKGVEQVGKDTLTITMGDYEAISKLPTVKSLAPTIFVTERVSYGREEIAPFVIGTYPEIFANWNLGPTEGRLLDRSDIAGAKSVVVIGSQAAEDLFENESPLGKRIAIGPRKFTVIGVLEGIGTPLAGEFDSFIYMPFPVAKAMMGRSLYIDYISLQSTGDNELARLDIVSVLRQRHKINNPEDDPDKDDFIARSFEQATEVISSVTLGITIFLGIIAGISLIVGGVGIMNIMLVSVTERTREIGLRKAVGARKRDILLQFLLEAVTLTVTGGIIGLIGGVSFGLLITLIAAKFLGSFAFAFSPLSVALALTMAITVGLLFGIYPARRAANLDPIEALRYE